MASPRQCASPCWLCVRVLVVLVVLLSNRNYSSHPTEPQCSYDPVEGLTLAPDTDPVEKIKDLEDQICESTDFGFNSFAIHECSSTT
jgi:hypothetical protein